MHKICEWKRANTYGKRIVTEEMWAGCNRSIVCSHAIDISSNMNLFQLLLLTVAVASTLAKERVRGLAPRDEVQVEGNGQSGRVKGGANASGRRRELKGGMSGSKGSKGPSECATLSIWIRTGDVMDNAIDSENGYATKLDVYAVGSRAVIGSWYEQASYVNEAGTDGVGTGLILWSGGGSSISFSGAL
jgi:hypothetical protein